MRSEVNSDFLVLAEQIQFTKCIRSIEVSERHSATFECEFSFDNATVTWYKDSWELNESPKYNFRSEGRRHFMTIRNVTLKDEGLLNSDSNCRFYRHFYYKKKKTVKTISKEI